MTKHLLWLTLAGPALAQAHDGHGQGGGGHWHATDAWGFAIGLAAVALLLWLARKE